jgi:acyl-coenzyme A synthetase/AMP-(fatty) acid ligase
MTGYRGDPVRDAEAMRDGSYHTGDVASRDSDGYLTYVGRTDDLFKAWTTGISSVAEPAGALDSHQPAGLPRIGRGA